MPPVKSEWLSNIPEEDAAELLEREEVLIDGLYEQAKRLGEKLRDGRSERAHVYSPTVEYQVEGQPEGESTEAWLSNFIRFENSEQVSLHTHKIVRDGQGEKTIVEGSQVVHFTICTGGPRVEIDSSEFTASDVRGRVAFLGDSIATLHLIEEAPGTPTLVPYSEEG